MVVRRNASHEEEYDSEMEDLIRHGSRTNGRSSVRNGNSTARGRTTSVDSTEVAALNLDHLTNRKVKVSTPGKPKGKLYKTYNGRTVSMSEYCISHISMLCFYYPCACGCLVSMILVIILVLLASLMINPTREYGTMTHDHSNIKSKYDLNMGSIDHWCLGGGNKHCSCEDPLVPTNRWEYKSWSEAFKANRKIVKRFEDPIEGATLDVAFVGESIIEEIDGRWMGKRGRSEGLTNLERLFNQHFRKRLDGNATLEGVALGIAGDTAPNVLWRLMHGEMADFFQPKVWWLSLGNNDLGRMECSEEIVVIGILRVVEEILERRPFARVVINSLFPMTILRGGSYPVISDFEDSFILLGSGRRQLRLSKQKPTPTSSPVVLTEEEFAAMVEKEEELRDKLAKKDSRRKHTPSTENPIMLDQSEVHKYKYGTPFVEQTDKPLWTSIRAINKELRKFAEKNERVYFFDGTELFTRKAEKKNSYKLLTDRISIRGHPTESGFQVWEDEMAKTLDRILTTMKQEQPELFKSPLTSVSNAISKDPATTGVDDDIARLGNNDDLDDAIIHGNDDGYYRNPEAEEEGILPSAQIDDDDEDDEGGGNLVVPDD